MFEIGDVVYYPMHGLGKIEAIEEREVLNVTARYYILRLIAGKMTAMVPVDTAEKVGIRYIIEKDECDNVVSYMKTKPIEENCNWNQRYRENYEKMRGGNVFDIADVVKCLMKRDSEKGLSSGERRMLNNARSILIAEIAASSGRDDSETAEILGL